MTHEDIELLELAALAVGINGFYAKNFDDWYEEGIIYTDEYDCNCSWNPLVNDDDALRLAVNLRLPVVHYSVTSEGKDRVVAGQTGVPIKYDGDPYAATRRAIVRAAAEIGKELLSKKEK